MSLTPSIVREFVEHTIWQELIKRIGPESSDFKQRHDKAVDAQDPYSAGWYRAMERVFSMPQFLLDEIEASERKSGNPIKRISGLSR